MQKFNVSERLTHKYVGSWQHRDNWKFLATVQATPPRLVREPDEREFSDGGAYLLHVRAPSGAPDLRQGLRDTFTKHGCSHQHDCCGCRSTRASVRKVSARDYIVVQSVSFNY